MIPPVWRNPSGVEPSSPPEESRSIIGWTICDLVPEAGHPARDGKHVSGGEGPFQEIDALEKDELDRTGRVFQDDHQPLARGRPRSSIVRTVPRVERRSHRDRAERSAPIVSTVPRSR